MFLPFLEAMLPPFTNQLMGATPPSERLQPKRMVSICNNLGLLPEHFFPKGSGRDYELSPYLSNLAEHKDDFTVLSGVSHPGVDGSHSSDVSFLTAAPHPGGGGFRNTVSLDQVIAREIGHLTRFPSLTLGVNAKPGERGVSWTDSGVLIPCESKASNVYKQLFLQGTKNEIENQLRRLQLGESIMDTIASESKALNRRLGKNDRDRMDQYLTAVREVERRLEIAQEWERIPKPKARLPMPTDPESAENYMDKTQLMYEMALLALETDSTRSITIFLDSLSSPTILVPGAKISDGYHNLSHHGKSEEKLKQLEAIDHSHMKLLNKFISDLKGTEEGGGKKLLDDTLVLYGSNFGDASKHTTTNMPIVVAGGQLRHGQHLAFDRKDNYPLPNLYVSMLQSMGFEMDGFASATGTMTGLDIM